MILRVKNGRAKNSKKRAKNDRTNRRLWWYNNKETKGSIVKGVKFK